MPSVRDLLRVARAGAGSSGAQSGARFREILSIVRRHGLITGGLTPQRAVAVLQDLGPTFVKLGQIVSTHPDVLPPAYCEALGAMRANVTPMDFPTVRAQVERELGRPLEEAFSTFEETPRGAASIAQVHRATLPDGSEVAVKVLRPGIVQTVMGDLAILERLVELYSLVDRTASGVSFSELVDEMVETSTRELDLLNEADNLDRFCANNEGRDGVGAPRCHRALTTAGMLVEDFVDAPSLEEIEDAGMTAAQREELGYRLTDNYLRQILTDGFYHADPHPGNLLLAADGTVVWIDFGIMGTLTDAQRAKLAQIGLAMARGDAYALKKALLKVLKPRGAVDHARLLELCEETVHTFVDTNLDDFDTVAFVDMVLGTLRDQGFDVDPFLLNLARGLVTMEGTVHLVSPTVNIMRVLTRFAGDALDPKRLQARLRHLTGRGLESVEGAVGLPAKVADLLDMVSRGQAKVGMELSGTEKFSKDMRAAAGLISLGFVAAALILGAVIVGTFTNAFPVAGVSAFSLFGLAVGTGMTLYIMAKVRPYL